MTIAVANFIVTAKTCAVFTVTIHGYILTFFLVIVRIIKKKPSNRWACLMVLMAGLEAVIEWLKTKQYFSFRLPVAMLVANT